MVLPTKGISGLFAICPVERGFTYVSPSTVSPAVPSVDIPAEPESLPAVLAASLGLGLRQFLVIPYCGVRSYTLHTAHLARIWCGSVTYPAPVWPVHAIWPGPIR